ncbi:hypothetical protein F9K33_11480 [bacterium]|nr:MAG: hypothetical protein F9K33_11480 [bacterium]
MNACWQAIMFSMLIILPLYSQTNIKDKIKIPDSTTVQILTTTDGSTLNGRIIEINEADIRFESNVGIVQIPIQKIKDIKEILTKSIHNGEYWFPNPNSTRLYIAPTGRMLKSGEGYFQNIYIFFIGGAFGITNNITMGGGISIFPGAPEQVYYLTPKVGFQVAKSVNVAVGTLLMGATGGGETIGIHYGVGSIGNSDGSVTAGLGWGYSGSHVADKPIIMLGAEKRLTRRTAFVTENWIVPNSDGSFLSFGLRFFGEGLAIDLAFIRPTGVNGDVGIGIPYVDFVINLK